MVQSSELNARLESKGLGVHLGPLIAVERYDRVAEAIWRRFPAPAQGASEYAVAASIGWTGLGYRARGAGEHKEAFSQLFQLEPAAPQEQRYQQDSHFFGFVTNAAAAAESLVFAVHALALGIGGQELTEQLLKRQRGEMVRTIQAVKQLEGLGRSLQLSLDMALPLFEMRDVLLHRGRLPRNHFVGGEFDSKMTLASNPKAVPEEWEDTFVFGAESCDANAAWLGDLVSDSMTHLEVALGVVGSGSDPAGGGGSRQNER
jgi:hypothetical protein